MFSVEDVGYSSGLIGVLAFISSAANLGIGFSVIRYVAACSDIGEQIEFVNSAYTLTGVSSASMTILYLAIAPLVTPELAPLLDSPWTWPAITSFAMVWTWFGLSTQVLLAFRAGSHVLLTRVVANATRLPLPLVLNTASAYGIVLSTFIGMALSVGLLHRHSLRTLVPGYRWRWSLDSQVAARLISYGGPNFAANWLWQVPNALMPVVVLNKLGPEPSAHFLVAFLIASLVYTVGTTAAQALFAEASHDESRMRAQSATVIGFALVSVSAIVVVTIVCRGPLLSLFGSAYATNSSGPLEMLTLAAVGISMSALAQSVLRVQRRFGTLLLVSSIPLIAALVGGLFAESLIGYSSFWLAGASLSGAVGLAAIGRSVWGHYGTG